MKPNYRVTALVPAYNEAPRIAVVLETILSYPYIDETIVIDDGSTDGTGEVANKFPVQLLSFEENRGKGAALQLGLDNTPHTDFYVFLDADLINLMHEHINALLEPLLNHNHVFMTVGIFRSGQKNSVNLAQHYFSILNGQRAMKKKFASILPDLSWSKFGVEILLSKYAELSGHEVHYPELYGITHVTKEEKLGFLKGFRYRLQMFQECLFSLFNYKKMILKYPGNTPSHVLEKLSKINNAART